MFKQQLEDKHRKQNKDSGNKRPNTERGEKKSQGNSYASASKATGSA